MSLDAFFSEMDEHNAGKSPAIKSPVTRSSGSKPSTPAAAPSSSPSSSKPAAQLPAPASKSSEKSIEPSHRVDHSDSLDSPEGEDQDSGYDATVLANTHAQSTEKTEDVSLSLHKIADLTKSMGKRLGKAVREIDEINLQTRLLSFNAQVEASRAGSSGRAFGVVAKEMVDLATRTSGAATKLDAETKTDIRQLSSMINDMGSKIRGTRLSDLAFTNIELIDRNLYERTCDVRWWATDSACVEACLDHSQADHASRRLSIILDSYTVYYDIVLCSLDGTVLANGRPEKFSCVGTNQAATQWFRSAQTTRSGTEFGFQSVHQNPSLANNQYVLVYSCTVRRDGSPTGEPLGVLGVVFNWESLGQTIVNRTQIGDSEKEMTRVCITDEHGNVLADNKGKLLRDQLDLADKADLIELRKGYTLQIVNDEPQIVAYAQSPGYETYSTGWHSFIIQKLNLV